MRKIITLLMAVTLVVNTTSAAFTETKTEQREIKNTFSCDDQRVATDFFARMNRKEYEQLAGRHLSLLERFAFRWTQKRAHKNFEGEKQSKGFNPIGFFVPLVLGIIGWPLSALIGFGLFSLLLSIAGVAGTYVFSKDKNMHKWAWIGFGAYIIILIAIVVILLASGYFAG